MAKKNLQKVLALLMAFSMLMSLMSVTAFAEEPSEEETHAHKQVDCTAENCNGGKVVEVCETCGGNGEVEVDCTACDENGQVDGKVACPNCSGNGTIAAEEEDAEPATCETCKGSGEVDGKVTCQTCGGDKKVDAQCATCGGTGKVTTTEDCSKCGGTGKVDCNGEFVGAVTTPATCKTEGVMTYTCATCGESYTETIAIDPAAHTWDDGKVTTEPTCTTEGVKKFTCTQEDCGATKEEKVDALGHEWDAETHKCKRPGCGVDQPAVAKIREKEYYTVDAAIEEALDGDTIQLLADVEATKTFYKSLTFTGGHTLSMDTYGWRYKGDLTFDGANFSINSDEKSPVANNGEAGRWFTMVLDGSINAKNGATVSFNFDSASGTNCAIYTGGGVTIKVENDSHFNIFGKNTKGVSGQGIQLDSTAETGIFVTNHSTFLIDGTNRGYVNSPTIYVEDSTFTVQNCTSNASNGGKFTAINSTINFLNNTGHGLSATTLDISEESVVTCNHNGYYGVTVVSSVAMDGTSELTSNENGWGYTGGALRLAKAYTTATFAQGAEVTLDFNYRNALENYGTTVFENGVVLEIHDNKEPNKGAGVYNGASGKLTLPENASIMRNTAEISGGGIYNKVGGVVQIPASVKLYNNHAKASADDICNDEGGSITFGPVGSNWYLDGVPSHCKDKIDGWYYDGHFVTKDENDQDVVLTNRWDAHAAEEGDRFVHLYTVSETAVEGELALKAAHPYIVPPADEEYEEKVENDDPPEVVIQPEPTPLEPAPVIPEEPVTEIPEEEIPLVDVPKTGDVSALWLALTALSGSGLAVVSLRKKRDEE